LFFEPDLDGFVRTQLSLAKAQRAPYSFHFINFAFLASFARNRAFYQRIKSWIIAFVPIASQTVRTPDPPAAEGTEGVPLAGPIAGIHIPEVQDRLAAVSTEKDGGIWISPHTHDPRSPRVFQPVW
jgi:hypothetical protein